MVPGCSFGLGGGMSLVASDRRRVVMGAAVVLAAVFALVTADPLAVVRSPFAAAPREVFGVLVPGIMIVVGLSFVFGSETSVHESFTLGGGVVVAVIAVYLLVSASLVAMGHTGWVSLMHLAISAGGAFVVAYSVLLGRPIGQGST